MKALFAGFVFFVALISLGSMAQAQVLVSVSKGLAFEKANNGRSTEIRRPLALRLGYRTKLADFHLESNVFEEAQGGAVVRVKREHREWLLWTSRILVKDWKLKPFLGVGAGVQSDTVTTSLAAETRSDTGKSQPVAAVAGGFKGFVGHGFEIGLESRLSVSSGYTPNPLPALGCFVGYRF